MQRNRLYRRSKSNPWRNTWRDKTKKTINGRKVAAILVLVIAMPLFTVGIANGILSRAADVYQYNLRSTQAVSDGNQVVSEEDLVALLGDFMQGKTDEFYLLEDLQYDPQNVFTDADQQVMTDYRHVARIELYLGLVGGILVLGMLIFLIATREKAIHMMAMRWAGVSTLLVLILDALAKVYPPVRGITYGSWIPFSLPEGDFLRDLVGQSFAIQMAVMAAIVVVILYLLLLYLTWQVAGKRRLFKGSPWEEKQAGKL